MDWLKNHVFVAAWASPIIALVGLLVKKSTGDTSLNWSKVMIYVAFLTCLAVAVTPGMDPGIRMSAGWIVGAGFGFLIVDSGRWRQ